jgi:hypothetical protein
MAYLQITGKLEDYSESSYTLATGEQRTRIQLTLSVPSMRDRVLCEFNIDQAPATSLLDRWEMDESWVIVSASSYRALGFNRKNPRAGERAVGALVVFQATEAHEASPEERAQLQEAKKAARIAARQRRSAQRETVQQSA